MLHKNLPLEHYGRSFLIFLILNSLCVVASADFDSKEFDIALSGITYFSSCQKINVIGYAYKR